MKNRSLIFMLIFPVLMFAGNFSKESLVTTDTQQNNILDNFIEAKLENDRLYLGIPKVLLSQPMLFINHQEGARLENKYVHWKQHAGNLFLETPGVIKSSSGVLIPMTADNSMRNEIIAVFEIIEEKSTEKIYWINATDMFLKKLLSGWKATISQGTAKNQSYIKGINFFENELVIKTFMVNTGKSSSWSEEVDYSLYLLPKPMKSRSFDHRIGFFSADYMNFNPINYKAETPKANISRWRLEKKNKNQLISNPVKPITFILTDAIPKKWKPYVKAGVLEWLPAFEAAGFENAIVVKEDIANDSDLNFNSIHRNLISWGDKRNVRGYENKKGSSAYVITDLITGEILSANISIGSSYQSIMDEYIIRCGALDDRAQQYPVPDELLGALIQALVAHEAGHAFGLKDANYGEYTYPFEKMRDEKWLLDMGYSPSIMNYTRYSFIPQPKDSIDPSLLIPKLGPTDIYSIKWAYTPLDDFSLDEEKKALENIVREQDSIPWYRYNIGQEELIGPGATDEVVESTNPIESTRLGLKNIKKVLELLPKINENQSDHSLIDRLYEKVLELWFKQMRQVLSLIGGYTIYYQSGEQGGNSYTPIGLDIQEDAFDFFVKHAFRTPNWLACPEWKTRNHYSTYPDKLMDFQIRLLMESINQRRLKRLEYLEQNHKGFEGITAEFLTRLQRSLFYELNTEVVQINDRKQELQQLYVDALLAGIQQRSGQLNATGNINYSAHSKSLITVNLLNLKSALTRSLDKKTKPDTYGHLKLLLKKLDGIE